MRLRIVYICMTSFAAAIGAQPADVPHDGAAANAFVTSDQCIACHSNLHSSSGQDVSIGYNWRASMMANSARDPYWHAAVRREVLDHPESHAAIEDTCSTCHMPMARSAAAAEGTLGRVFANLARADDAPHSALAMDGVSCTVCHQIRADNFGEADSFDGGFVIEPSSTPGARAVFGPYDVAAGHQTLMQSAAQFVPRQATHLQESELCATCHTLYTHALNDAGEAVGELPEQVPYQEWLHSDYRETQSCQMCHMPEVAEDVPISSVLGVPRPGMSRHDFRGANAFMLGMLNKYRGELGVTALPQELHAAARSAEEYLGSQTAQLTIESARVRGSVLEADVGIVSWAGHKLPTAYPSRRVWLHFTVTDGDGAVLFQSGALRRDGSIAGNDNDADALTFEPHYEQIDSADQVQIYEPIMADANGRVTTGLLRGVRYIKDNRILPRGFDKTTAPHDVAVQGVAVTDPDFVAGGDRVRYRVELPDATRRPVRVAVELRYQSIGYRWAENLRMYDAAETRRFVSYYEATAGASGLLIAAAAVSIESDGPQRQSP